MPEQRPSQKIAVVAAPEGAFASPRWLVAGGLLLVALIFASYHNSLNVPFIFDDTDSILQNQSIRHLDTAFSPPPGTGITVSGRPVLNASFALNYALSGTYRVGFHVGNILIHALAALTLWAVVRRTLQSSVFVGKFSQNATTLAWFISALWAVHPLQTESVTYTVQRAESLVGLFYLLTLYGFIRYAANRSWRWFLFTGLACLLGMGSKEVMATAPIVIFLYDRTFVSGSFRKARQQHGRLHLCLAATLILLGTLVLTGRGRGGSVGVNETVTWWGYLCTQAVALVRYVWLVVWPARLTLDYGMLVEKNYAVIVPCALAVIGALVATTKAVVRRPTLGFIGLWFFALLAPSSSVIPVVTQTVAEHRMYLSLAALTTAAVLLAHRWLGKHYWILLVLIITSESITTFRRNIVYQNDVALWEDTVAKQPANARALNNLGTLYIDANRIPEAIKVLTASLAIDPDYPEANANIGQAFADAGRPSEARAYAEKGVQLAPERMRPNANYANVLAETGDPEKAIPYFEKALSLSPENPQLHCNLANTLASVGRDNEAIEHYKIAIAGKADDPEAIINYGAALQRIGHTSEAIALYEQILRAKPDFAGAHNNLGMVFIAEGKMDQGLEHLREARRLDPKRIEAHQNLALALTMTGHIDEAISETEQLLPEAPDANTYNNLGALYGKIGRFEQAAEAFQMALQLNPDLPGVNENLAKLRMLSAKSSSPGQ
jgi:tetratricopeptide (TPR) repeat protein